LANGASVSFSIGARVPPNTASGTVLTNSATVTASSPAEDTNAANNTATAMTTVQRLADLAITKTGPATATAGTDITYTVTVTNNGPSTSSGGTVTDTLPAGTTFAGASSGCSQTAPNVVTCTVGTLANGASVSFSIGARVPPNTASGTVLTNSATVTASSPAEDTNAAKNTATAMTTVQRLADLAITKTGPATATASNPGEDTNGANNTATAMTTVQRFADLAITKTGPGTATAGTDITYTVTVTNNGPSTSSGGTVTDTLPVGTMFAGASSGCSQTAPNVVTCTLSTLA